MSYQKKSDSSGEIHLFFHTCDDERAQFETTDKMQKSYPTGIRHAYEYICIYLFFVSVNIVFVMWDHKNKKIKQKKKIDEDFVARKWMLCLLRFEWMYKFGEWKISLPSKKNTEEQEVSWRCCWLIRCNIYEIAHFKFFDLILSLHHRNCELSYLISFFFKRFVHKFLMHTK